MGGFALAGPSRNPDSRTHAYRQDLADAALAGMVIASHYADPLEKTVAFATDLLAAPGSHDVVARLAAGDTFLMLDCNRGWAWGYAGPARLVGYVAYGEMVD